VKEDLASLRERIRQIDVELVARAAERVELARKLGAVKRRQGLPTVDYEQERVVLDRARDLARERGLDSVVAEDLLAGLIRASVTAQDQENLRLSAAGAGKKAVVVGGAGRMGGWFVRFLSAQGYRTGVLDPAGGAEQNEWSRGALESADLVVCSTPPAATVQLYSEWSANPPRGLIVDIASIKTPLLDPISDFQRAGATVASIHPMFGPSTVLLRDADVVVCETSDRASAALVEKLFAPTTAHLVRIPIEEHDRIMADLLSLAHATAIAFALALPDEEHPVRSTTFQALESLAGEVVRESPDVYYEIQAENPSSITALERLGSALERILSAVQGRDQNCFRDLMDQGRKRTARTR
jgi:chorismate mutase / prephenate dehydrogenase